MTEKQDQQPTPTDSNTIWMQRLALVLAEANATSLAKWTFIVMIIGC